MEEAKIAFKTSAQNWQKEQIENLGLKMNLRIQWMISQLDTKLKKKMWTETTRKMQLFKVIKLLKSSTIIKKKTVNN